MYKIIKAFVLRLIRFYQKFLSFDTGLMNAFATGPVCRHVPTCSEYTYQAIVNYGMLRGGYLGLKRLLTCHPFYHD